MDKRERIVREDISDILKSKDRAERIEYIKQLKAYLYTESKKINDMETEKLLQDKEYMVYVV